MEVSRNKLIIVDPDEKFGILSRSGELDDSGRLEANGGKTDVEFKWWGTNIYLSNQLLHDVGSWLSDGNSLVAGGLAMAQFAAKYPTVAALGVPFLGALLFDSAVCNILAKSYPNGVIIQKPYVGPIMWPVSQ